MSFWLYTSSADKRSERVSSKSASTFSKCDLRRERKNLRNLAS
jgi:hypothetical protein